MAAEEWKPSGGEGADMDMEFGGTQRRRWRRWTVMGREGGMDVGFVEYVVENVLMECGEGGMKEQYVEKVYGRDTRRKVRWSV